jgi:hypothetical protein
MFFVLYGGSALYYRVYKSPLPTPKFTASWATLQLIECHPRTHQHHARAQL